MTELGFLGRFEVHINILQYILSIQMYKMCVCMYVMYDLWGYGLLLIWFGVVGVGDYACGLSFIRFMWGSEVCLN